MTPDARPIQRVQSLLFECTWRCNQACRFCYNIWNADPDTRPPERREASTRRSRKIIRKVIRESGAERVAFTGGEPTLRHDLVDLVATARMQGVGVSVLTNGSLVDDELVRDLARVGCDTMQLTFCGLDAETHDALCGEGTFARTRAALDVIRGAGMKLGLTFVATRHNWRQAGRFAGFVRQQGGRVFLLNRFNPGGNGIAEDREQLGLLPHLSDLRQMLRDVNEVAGKIGARPFVSVPLMPCLVDFRAYEHVRFAQGCAAGTERSYFTVDPWGDVRFCNHTPTVLGNVLERPFLDLANDEQVQRFRDTRPPFCVPCPGWDRCRGGCRAAAEQLTGRWDVEDPLLAACITRGEVKVGP